jgi:hypothetical protein
LLILTHSIVLYILFTLGGVVHCTVFVDLSQTYHPPPTLIKNSAFNISTGGAPSPLKSYFKIPFQNPISKSSDNHVWEKSNHERDREQAGAELCQAQVKLGLSKQAVTKTKLKTYKA